MPGSALRSGNEHYYAMSRRILMTHNNRKYGSTHIQVSCERLFLLKFIMYTRQACFYRLIHIEVFITA
jgi:hypothetical protein